MKRLIVIAFVILLLTGCNNVEEKEKNDYLAMKSKLLEQKNYTDLDDLACDIIVDVNRVNDENLTYTVELSKASENMHDIEVIVVHNYYTEEVFPTIGLFDSKRSLYMDTDKKIKLAGTIKSTNDIANLNLELKILIHYTTDEGEEKDIYYKTTK